MKANLCIAMAGVVLGAWQHDVALALWAFNAALAWSVAIEFEGRK